MPGEIFYSVKYVFRVGCFTYGKETRANYNSDPESPVFMHSYRCSS